ncbi:hypothetical protein PINS_up022639 [Pythium insidiosum]|nr:hypothetical protein PINS_up022639 [Pythium insidiosum]
MGRLGPSKSVVSPEAIRAMPWRQRVQFYLAQPTKSRFGWVLHHVLTLILIVNIGVMAAETLDGPRFEGTDPGYGYLPGDSFFVAAEVLFTAIYVIDFLLRWLSAPNQKAFWKALSTWNQLAALSPLFIYRALEFLNRDEPTFNKFGTRATVNYLQLCRIFRLIDMSRVYDGSIILFKAAAESVAPLKITVSAKIYLCLPAWSH